MDSTFTHLDNFTDVLNDDEIVDSQPISLSINDEAFCNENYNVFTSKSDKDSRPAKGTGQHGEFRCVEEIDPKYRSVFTYPYFNLVQSRVIEDAIYSDKSMVVCAPTGSGKTVIFEMAIVQLLMDLDDRKYDGDFKIIYMAPVKALCTERLTEWYPKFTKLGLLCIEVTGDTDVDFSQLKPYKVIITTPEKWDMLTRRWRDHRGLVELIKLFLIDEVHILNDDTRGPVLEAVVSRMKTVESSAQSAHRLEELQRRYGEKQQSIQHPETRVSTAPRIRFVAISATVSNPEDVAAWLETKDNPAIYHKFGDECRPVKIHRVVEGYPCPVGTSIFKFDIILNYKLWPIIQRYSNGKPTLVFCNTRKSVALTAETLSKELTINFNPEQRAILTELASTIKTKKLQSLVLNGVGCHHAGLLYEDRNNIERAFRNRDLPILITTTTLAMGVNLPAHLVIVKNTQQYVNGAYQEYCISTVLQMVGRAGRPQFDTEATAVIMTRLCDKRRYQALVSGSEPLQSYLHKRLAENLNSETALGTVGDVAQCVQWLRSTFLNIRAAKDPRRYLGVPASAPPQQISKKIEELCVKAMNRLAGAGLITKDEACCIQPTEAGRLMSIYYLDLETMKNIMAIKGDETLDRLLWIVCESHELSEMHLRVEERRCLNTLNRNNAAATIRFPMKGKITTRQMKLNCVIQAILGCLPIPDPSLNQEASKVIRIADRVCKCLVAYVTRSDLVTSQPKHFSAVLNSIILAKCVTAHLWENSVYVSRQLKGIGPAFSTSLATAGKVNFLLLEESHPRDLERIMNKGAPAGNILRKQVSLLPKYQITLTPLDEKSVSVKLFLLNQSYLIENIANLTAGENHKSYIIGGDSENNLLLFSSFKDKDLICLYDGTITFNVTRKVNSDHKIFVHCISSAFVGIDVQSEYPFNRLEPFTPNTKITHQTNTNSKMTTSKQSCITDTFKERKRKQNNTGELTQSKEKKKRESAMLNKLRFLKDSFQTTTDEFKEELQRSTGISKQIFSDLTGQSNFTNEKQPGPIDEIPPRYEVIEIHEPSTNKNDNDGQHDLTFENILREIENEICNKNLPKVTLATKINVPQQATYNPQKQMSNSRPKLFSMPKKIKPIRKKSNYSFLDKLEKQNHTDEEHDTPRHHTVFSDSIKGQIEKYLDKAKTVTQPTTSLLTNIVRDEPIIKNTCTTIENESNEDKKDLQNTDVTEINFKQDSHSNQIDSEDFTDSFHENHIELSKKNRSDGKYCNEMDMYLTASESNEYLKPIQDNFAEEVTSFTKKNSRINKTDDKYKPVDNINPRETLLEAKIAPNLPKHNEDNSTITNPEYTPKKSLDLTVGDYSKRSLESHEFPKNYKFFDEDIGQATLNNYENHQSYYKASSNNATDREESIRKFSYKTFKTNVSNKITPTHEIQVIRQLKVDLDITEIVSIKKKESSVIIEENEVKNIGSNKIDPFKSDCFDLKIYHNVPTALEGNNSTTWRNSSREKNTSRLNKKDKDLDNMIGYHMEQKGWKLEEKNNVNENFETQNNLHDTNVKPHNETHNKRTVKDILNKYRKIQQPKNTKTENIENNFTEIVNKQNPKIDLKGKNLGRPFRISDIDKVETALPSFIIPQTPISNATFICTRAESINSEEVNKIFKNNDLNYNNKEGRISNICEDINENEENTDEDFADPEFYLPIQSCTPVTKEPLPLENSLFDPKALLMRLGNLSQSTTNNCEDLIPPPSQFCNESNSYEELLDTENWTSYNDLSLEEKDLSVFDDIDRDVAITPSREIETWTFPIINDTTAVLETQTVINKTSPQLEIRNYSNRSFNTRREKLHKFKFTRKKNVL